MKNKKCSFVITATLAILIAAQFVTQCRGDDGGTLRGTVRMDTDSTMCLTKDGDYTGATTVNAGALVIAGELDATSTGSLTCAGNAMFIINGGTLKADTVYGATADLSSGRLFVKSDNGTLKFSGNNTYTGSTTINGGTLQIGNASLGTMQIDNSVTVSGATLDLGGCVTSAGTIRLSGNNTFTGATTISSGTLQFNNASSGTLQIDNSVTISGITLATDGYGVLTKSGAGTLTLNGSLNYTGLTDIQSGTLNIAGSIILPSVIGDVTIVGNLNNPVSLVYNSGTLVGSSLRYGTLTIGSGATVQLVSLSGIGTGTPLIVNSPESVPEPSALVLLSIAALGFMAKALGLGRRTPCFGRD
jgi:fibronectin-binding autotransporter adhesin